MKKKNIFLIFTVIFLLNTITTTENCITGYACKINPENITEENKKSDGLIHKMIDDIMKKEKHDINIHNIKNNNIPNNTGKNMKIQKQNY